MDTCFETCGDGWIVGNEVCDDGNNRDFDGCAGDCRSMDPGWGCTDTEPTVCNEFGNGVLALETGEECDDGNRKDLDGCTHDMKVEDGWLCDLGSPTTCD
jgi:cysteine-rich repeat protein